MVELWSNLVPLILASAALPLQTIVTLLLVRSSLRSAYAWLAGMTTVRLLQGVLFGVVLDASETKAGPTSPQYFLGILLLVLALLLYVKAFRAAIGARDEAEDEDAPPPQWIAKAGSMSPLAAFAAGAGFMTLSFKFLIFTLGAIGAIAEAHLGKTHAALTFVLFVLLAACLPITILALASSGSNRSAALLEGVRQWLQRNNRWIVVIFGVLFGTWFLFKALARLGIV